MKILPFAICFLQSPVFSEHGLLTTVGYKFGPSKPAVYALEVNFNPFLFAFYNVIIIMS